MGLWIKNDDGSIEKVAGSGGGGGSFDGEHVLTGDVDNPPEELDVGQLMWDGVEGGSGGGGGPHDHDYLPLAGGTLTGDGHTLALKNATPSGQPYMSFYHNGIKKGYIGNATATTTELSAETNQLLLGGAGVRVDTDLEVDGTLNASGGSHVLSGGNAVLQIGDEADSRPYISWLHEGERAGYIGYPDSTSFNIMAENGRGLILKGTDVRVNTGGVERVAVGVLVNIKCDLQVDGIIHANKTGAKGNPSINLGANGTGIYAAYHDTNGGKIRTTVNSNIVFEAEHDKVSVYTDLGVNGIITDKNGPVRSFATADGIDTADVLDRAETATMPVIDDEGVATTDAEVDSITVNEVVTALLAKVKELSAEIEELKGA